MNIIRNIVASRTLSHTAHTVNGHPMTLSADPDNLAHDGWRIEVPVSPSTLLKIKAGLYGDMSARNWNKSANVFEDLHDRTYSGKPMGYDDFHESVFLEDNFYACEYTPYRFFTVADDEAGGILRWLRSVWSKGKYVLDASKMSANKIRSRGSVGMDASAMAKALGMDAFDRLWTLWRPEEFRKFSEIDWDLPKTPRMELDLFDLADCVRNPRYPADEPFTADDIEYMKESMER